MTQDEFANHQSALIHDLLELRKAGQKEYAHDTSNAFRNFEAIARELGVERELVLWIYFRKHIDGILAHLRGHKSQRESVHGRIKDAIVYLTLLDGMITENEKVEATREEATIRAGLAGAAGSPIGRRVTHDPEFGSGGHPL